MDFRFRGAIEKARKAATETASATRSQKKPIRMSGSMVLGIALCQCWLTLCFFAPQLFPDNQATSVYEISLIVTAVSLLPGVMIARKMDALLDEKRLLYGLALCASLGTLIIPFSGLEGPAAALMIVAAILTGCGGGWLFIAWYRAFCRVDDLAGFVLSVTVQAIILYILTNLLLPPAFSPWLMMAVACLLPIVSTFLLTSCPKPTSESTLFDYDLPHVQPIQRRAIAQLCIAMFVISFVDEFMRNQYLESTDLLYYSGTVNLIVLVLKIICSVLILAAISERRQNVQLMYKASFLLTMIAILFMPYMNSDLGYGITNLGAFFFKIIVMLVTFNYCQRYLIAPVLLFALTRIVWSLDLFVGFFFSEWANNLAATVPSASGILSVVMGVTIVATYLFVFTSSEGDTALLKEDKQDEAVNAAEYESKCSRLKRVGKLSGREVDVLMLVARGRSTPRIQEELGLSSNTVNTHIRHIYQKLDVHSRQELLDLVEKTAPEDE